MRLHLLKNGDLTLLGHSLPGQDRRRNPTAFLTWAFFLSEVFKGVEAFASAPNSQDDKTSASAAPTDIGGAAAVSSDDQPILRDWSVASMPDGDALTPARLPMSSMPQISSFSGVGLDHGKSPVSAQNGAHGGVNQAAPAADSELVTDAGTVQGLAGNVVLDAGPIELEIGASLGPQLGLALDLAPVSLILAMSEGSDGLVGSIIDVLVPSAMELTPDSASVALVAPVQGIPGDVVVPGGIVRFGDWAEPGSAADALFSGGRYTDYHLALQLNSSSNAETLSTYITAHTGDHISLFDGHDAAEAWAQAGNMGTVDELTVRGSADLAL
jgi:hypothetical protein